MKRSSSNGEQTITEMLGRQRSLCHSANKLFSAAGMRGEIAEGNTHSLTASTTKKLKEIRGRICPVLALGNTVPGPVSLKLYHVSAYCMLYKTLR